MSTIEELTVFFGRIHLYFPSIRHKGLFCKNTKMYIFPTCFAKRNFRGHFLRKFLKTLPNKICEVMWGWEISTWRMKPINHLSRSNHRCNLLSILLYVLLQKYPRADFFIVSLLQVIKANDFNRDGCTKNIHRAVFLPKDENFFLCSSHFGKKFF